MYGMVNQAVKDLVVQKFGEPTWIKICDQASIPAENFVFMQYYPDKITYELVGAAAKILNMGPEVVLREFGKHWILFTAKEGYGPLMDLFGGDFRTCLQNLNNLHARMGMTMPHLTPPRFTFREQNSDLYFVQYFSERMGLSSMVHGLLEGLAEKYGIRAKIEYMKPGEGSNAQVFRIELLG